jgi:prefoldin subunit 5
MNLINSSNQSGPDKTHWLEKVFRIVIPAGLIFLGMKFFNSHIAPVITLFLENIWYTIGLGLPLAFIAIYVISNPSLIWMTYKNICRKITEALVKIDFLSYMDEYVEILKTKLANLKETKVKLEGKYQKLMRVLDTLNKDFDENMKSASAAKKRNLMNQAETLSSKAVSDKNSIELYLPIAERMRKNLDFLNKLEENWGLSIEKLEHEVKRKRQEYETLRDMADAIGDVEKFISGESEPAKIYKMSLEALEESLTQKIARIEAFERDSRSMMDKIDLDKQINLDEGMELLDQYDNPRSGVIFDEDLTYHPAQVVTNAPSSNISTNNTSLVKSSFTNLLKRKQ